MTPIARSRALGDEEEPITRRYDSNPPVSLVREIVHPRKESNTLRSIVRPPSALWMHALRTGSMILLVLLSLDLEWSKTIVLFITTAILTLSVRR